jgi:phosphopantothenoylcysteine decarboxylase/phosphopantothenate--cysteine ligase
MLLGKTVVLGVTGSIAAWQTPEIVGQLKDLLINVHCIMTRSATEFISPLTLQVASQNPVFVEMYDGRNDGGIAHTALAEIADLFLIAPATANIIGKMANGIADDLLSATVLATRAPVVIAPAMNPNMYANKMTQSNIERLEKAGFHFVGPEYGKAACGTEGVGRLARIPVIIKLVTLLLEKLERKKNLP